jgi:hypothetical protein
MHDRLWAKTLVQLTGVVQDQIDFTKYVYPSLKVEKRIKLLTRMGYLPSISTESFLKGAGTVGSKEPPSGYIDEISQSSKGQLIIRGWSVLSKKGAAALCTVLAYDDDRGQPTPFALAFGGMPRPDVVKVFKKDGYLESGWSTTVSEKQIPPGPRTIRAWAVDPESSRCYPIDAIKMPAAIF